MDGCHYCQECYLAGSCLKQPKYDKWRAAWLVVVALIVAVIAAVLL